MAAPAGAKKKLHTGRHSSAIKRARQAAAQRLYNRKYLGDMRKVMKAVRSAVVAKNPTAAKDALKTALPVVAKTARRGVIPKTTASRYISRLTKAVAKLAA